MNEAAYGREEPDADDEASRQDDEPVLAENIPCWRCGKGNAATATICDFCEAALGSGITDVDAQARSQKAELQPLAAMFIGYVALFSTAIATRIYYLLFDEEVLSELTVTVMIEVIDAAIVLALLAWASTQMKLSRSALRMPSWRSVAIGVVSLVAMLGLNMGYHDLMRRLIEADPATDYEGRHLAWFFAICVQPAIIEELYFRYFAFEALKDYLGKHALVWITAIMFGLLHVGVPLSIPVLVVLGVLLGYARHYGGLWLCVLLHFLHNLVIFGIEILNQF